MDQAEEGAIGSSSPGGSSDAKALELERYAIYPSPS
jgi:hypothetical protein